jgi:hypothetical protein
MNVPPKKSWWREPAHLIQCAGVFIGIIVAVIYFYQLRAMQDSVDLARKNMEIDQRPYLWTNNVDPAVSTRPGQVLWADFRLVNYGKSPGLRVSNFGHIFFGPNAAKEVDQWFARFGDKPTDTPTHSQTISPPGIPPNAPDAEIPATKLKPGEPHRNKMGFGAGLVTLHSDQVLTQQDVDYILSTDFSAMFVLRLEYYDGFGNFYWSNFCMTNFKSGGMPSCPDHNEMH